VTAAVVAPAPRLHFEVHPGTGPYLFLVHGMLSSQDQWTDNLAALGAVTQPVTIELWGHGRSPSPTQAQPYGMSAITDQLEALRNELGAPRIILCGQSFGACLTLRYGLRYPDRAIAHVLTNSMSALGEANDRRLEMARDVERSGAAAIEEFGIHPRHARRLPVEVQSRLTRAASSVNPGALIYLLRITAAQASVGGEVDAIKCPVLLVNGTREAAFQPYRNEIARRMPNLRVVDLDGGHAVNAQCAAQFNQAVTTFIRTVDHGARPFEKASTSR
jgi:pimeloyl-ACP methyl ester carboxylesterase